MAEQTFTVRLNSELARRVMKVLNTPGRGYDSLDEFVSVALLNQISAEVSVINTDGLAASQIHGLLARPPSDAVVKNLAEPVASSDRLFILTNRLSPLKIAARVLVNLQERVGRLADDREWPTVKTFQTTAGHAARALGFELQRLDRYDSLSGRDKRWTGYPVGRDERSSLERFAVSFVLAETNRAASGPLVILGLAAPIGGRAALTDAGWHLALAPSPLLDESSLGTLSDEERAIFTQQIGGAPGERAAVVEFLELVIGANGSQKKVDEMLSSRHRQWSANRTTAHRAAMVGRLCELGMLETRGRGVSARLGLLPAGQQFSEERGQHNHRGEEDGELYG